MSPIQEYDQHDALGLAALVKKGEVTAAELAEEAIRRMEEHNPAINAVVYRMDDLAREGAKRGLPDGPFTGVPYLLKDLLAAYAGVPMSRGSNAYKNDVSPHDSELVARWKKAGLNVVGKTNAPEFGIVGYTEPEAWGPCRNPWNLNHTPGGSSGGSAAAVAAGIVPMASGGDGGGSIRIPAACCGLFGIKPSRGRNPTGPEYGEINQGLVVEHVITRSVRDSAAALDATQGDVDGAPYLIAPPQNSYLEETKKEPGKLRIAFDTSSPIGKDVHPECVQAVRNAAKLLEELGHTVEEAKPGYDGKALGISYITGVIAETAADVAEVERRFGKAAARTQVELATRTLALLGRTISACDLVEARRLWNAVGRAMGVFYETHDLYLTPTLARPPVKIGELAMGAPERAAATVANALGAGKLLQATGLVEQMGTENLAPMPYTQLGNVAGLPSMSVPLHWTADGLPCGVLFTGPFGREDMMFRLAAQLEQAAPWFDQRPPAA